MVGNHWLRQWFQMGYMTGHSLNKRGYIFDLEHDGGRVYIIDIV